MLRGTTGKTFLVQFARPNGAIIFCRTFKNYFGQFVWIEKKEKKVTIIIAFHFMKRRLKINVNHLSMVNLFASSCTRLSYGCRPQLIIPTTKLLEYQKLQKIQQNHLPTLLTTHFLGLGIRNGNFPVYKMHELK